METLEYRATDKTDWAEGPWQQEPDKRQWEDAATGLPCLIVRGPAGALCGYVGVSEGHPAFGKGHDDVGAEVHGGLTFAGACRPNAKEESGICHKPAPGEPDHVWWLGFDTAHSGDFCPKYTRSIKDQRCEGVDNDPPWPAETYKTLAYVTRETERLAKQLAALSRAEARMKGEG